MTDGTQPAPAEDSTLVAVPAEHLTLVQRMLAALKRDEQWIVDNIHAGLQNLEDMFKSDSDDPAAPAEADTSSQAPIAETSAAQGQQASQ